MKILGEFIVIIALAVLIDRIMPSCDWAKTQRLLQEAAEEWDARSESDQAPHRTRRYNILRQ